MQTEKQYRTQLRRTIVLALREAIENAEYEKARDANRLLYGHDIITAEGWHQIVQWIDQVEFGNLAVIV